MIFQGLLRIMEMYFKDIETFYHNVDNYFLEKITYILKVNPNTEVNAKEALKEIILILIDDFVEIGLYRAKLQNRFFDKFITLEIEEDTRISSISYLYEKKIAPVIYELILEQIIFYLVNDRAMPIILYLKKKGLLPLEFIFEIRKLKLLLEKSPEKQEKLQKYLRIRDKIIIKFCENKEKIESLEDLDDPQIKMQLFYLIYKIIDFFDIQYIFNFSHMKEFLKDHFEDCMKCVPLISLKNPELYYCAIYLANELKVDFNHEKIQNFLQDLYKDLLDDFEVPMLEATNQIYFFLQSTSLVNLWLTDEQINEIVKLEPTILDINDLKYMETSQLGIILGTLVFVESLDNTSKTIIQAINDEIEKRITPTDIMQYRDGFYSSEASYFVIFNNYINNNLEKLKSSLNVSLLDNIIFKIYRNLEFLEFSRDMNVDLLSELFYSIESLRLLNCIKLEEFILLFVRYFFPEKIEEKILGTSETNRTKTRSKYLTINKITGESNFLITS